MMNEAEIATQANIQWDNYSKALRLKSVLKELGGFDDSISMGMLMKYIVKPIKIEIVLGRYSVTRLLTLSGGF